MCGPVGWIAPRGARSRCRRSRTHAVHAGTGGGHDLLHQTPEGLDSRCGLTASDHVGPVHIEGREVGPGAPPFVFVFDAHRATGLGRRGRVDALARLDACLLVRGHDELVVFQGLALPDPLIQIENGCGVLSELGVAGKDPGSMLPRANRILGEPPPNCAPTDGADQAGLLHIPRELRRLHRDSGTPCVEGNSQARALTCTLTSGGKHPRSPRAIVVVQPREPSCEEPLAPLGHHFSATVQLLSNLVVSPSVGGQENHLDPQDIKIRQRILSSASPQLRHLIGTQFDGIRTRPRHASRPPRSMIAS